MQTKLHHAEAQQKIADSNRFFREVCCVWGQPISNGVVAEWKSEAGGHCWR